MREWTSWTRGLAAIAALLCVGAVPAPAAETSPAPKLVVETPEIDLGSVARGKVAEAVFQLRNEGDADLRILSAKPG